MVNQHQVVEHLFGAALDLPREQRHAFLAEACAGAPELRARIDDLLAADEQMGDYLERPLFGPSSPALFHAIVSASNPAPIEAFPSTASSFRTGQLIAGRFQVVRFIARGGMGEVYEVEDQFLRNTRVALKIIAPHQAADESAANRFRQEVLLARKVVHPNVCPIYDIAQCSETSQPFLFLTMKLLGGETLACRLGRQKIIPQQEAVSILRQLCAGLGALHDADILHRDIKTSNVMLGGSGANVDIHIMDFGLARSHGERSSGSVSGLLAGTPGYLAPELLRGEHPSRATDIYALGILMQLVLTPGDSGVDLIPHDLATTAKLDTNASALLSLSVSGFCSASPERRIAAFKRIREYSEHLPPAISTDLATRERSGLSRRSFLFGATALSGAIAGGGLWKRDELRDMLHPLPQKRFVALLQWPASADMNLQPMLSEILDVVGRELARAEAFDRDLLIIAESASTHLKNASELGELRDSFGANLVLAACATSKANVLELSLKVLDAGVSRPLRERILRVSTSDQTLLPGRAVSAAAELLGIPKLTSAKHGMKAGTDRPEAYAAFQLAESLRRQNTAASLRESIPRYKDALQIDPRYASAMSGLAWAYLRSYALDNDTAALLLARANSEAAIRLDPGLVDAHQVLARVYEHIGDRQAATRELSAALVLDPSDPNTLLVQARLMEEAGQQQEASSRLNRVLQLRPNYWLAHNELGMLYNEAGDYSRALVEFRTASLAAPKNSIAANNVGSALLQTGSLEEAETSLKRSFSLEPNAAAALNLAALSRSRRRYAAAIAYAQQAVALDAKDAFNLLELGDSMEAAGLHAGSFAAYRSAAAAGEEQIQTEVANGPAWMLLAVCGLKAGMGSQALSRIEKAEHFGADDIDSQLLKVRAFELMGRRDDALIALERCLQKGATPFQVQLMPNSEELRADPRYLKSIAQLRSSRNSTT